ncbi:hypothetical protein [Qipengyuania sp.]|uniref:hypothetical protein n=1 Tax=Qipengyuania sp. TaxID=2004515 RepID=UPI003BAA3C85
MKKLAILGCTAVVAVFPASHVVAQDTADNDPYATCAALTDDPARLSCFDETYARQKVVIAKREEQERVRTVEDFGLSDIQIRERDAELAAENPPSPDAGSVSTEVVSAPVRPADVDDDESITSTVVEVFEDGARRQVVLLANGQLWRETSNSSWRGTIRSGWEATVRKHWSGGYRLKFGNRRGFLGVTRIR